MPKIDLTNKKFEHFIVLGRNEERTKENGRNVFWNCRCECGKTFVDTTTNINKGHRKSCGCLHAAIMSETHLQDLTGQQFGELTVLERDFEHPQNGQKPRTYWWCLCSCGNIKSIERTHLVNRNQISCGCKQSIGEYNINQILSKNNIHYTTQYTNSLLKTNNNGYLRFDFAILDDHNQPIRFIEFDGPQHKEETSNMHFSALAIIQERDAQKDIYAKTNNIPLVRIPYYKRDSMTIEDLLGDKFLVIL